GFRSFGQSLRPNRLPVFIQPQIAIVEVAKTTAGPIIRGIFFIKAHSMSLAMEGAYQRPIRRSVSIPPGGRDREPKDRDLHRSSQARDRVAMSRTRPPLCGSNGAKVGG